VAISTHTENVAKFGIDTTTCSNSGLGGGRYSLVAVGLSIALYIGMDNFEELLQGAHEADLHFHNTPYEQNIPVIMAYSEYGIIIFLMLNLMPYCLTTNPYVISPILSQGDMESNGKSITCRVKKWITAPDQLFGTTAPMATAFFQLIHQGTKLIPVTFWLRQTVITSCRTSRYFNFKFLAQPEALMNGITAEEVKKKLTPAEQAIPY